MTRPSDTEAVTLTEQERTAFFRMLADYKRNWLTTSNALQVVESILAARLAGAGAQVTECQERCCVQRRALRDVGQRLAGRREDA